MNKKLFQMKFSKLYDLYIAKAQRKNRTKEEVDDLILWLTGYTEASLNEILSNETTVQEFFNHAKNFNKNSIHITGKICGVVIEDIDDPLMKRIRYLDKLIDELAKGKSMDKIKRKEP